MRKLIWRVVLLALILIAALVLRGRIKLSGPETAAPEETESVEAVSALRAAEPLRLGMMSENTERGGVDIAVASESGETLVYSFTDVARDSWYAEAVNFVVSNGLMNGASDEPLFRPDFGVQRETFALLLYRFAHAEPAAAPQSGYEDVAKDAWYHDAVYWAAENGILRGESATAFGVGEFVTCEEALCAIYRLAGEPKTDATLAGYPYAPKVSEAGRAAVAWAWDSRLITEEECVWYPTQVVSRAQVALLLMRCTAAGL